MIMMMNGLFPKFSDNIRQCHVWFQTEWLVLTEKFGVLQPPSSSQSGKRNIWRHGTFGKSSDILQHVGFCEKRKQKLIMDTEKPQLIPMKKWPWKLLLQLHWKISESFSAPDFHGARHLAASDKSEYDYVTGKGERKQYQPRYTLQSNIWETHGIRL